MMNISSLFWFEAFLYVACAFLQVLLLLALAPLVNTIIKKMKAFLQNRRGPVLWQAYYDLNKWFAKETIVPNTATALFLFSPPVVFVCMLATSLLLPTFFPVRHIQPLGGVIVFVGLLGLARFFMTSAALESPSGFGGMGSNREMMLGSLIEPVLLLSLFVFVLFCDTTNIHGIAMAMGNTVKLPPSVLVAMLSLYISIVAEMGRVPFDNPETHYELTMIHEGMLLEYSGRPLALLHWAAWLKQLVLLSLLAIFLPPYTLPSTFSIQLILLAGITYVGKILFLCAITAIVETTIAKVRIFRNKDLTGGAFVLALLALVLTAQDLAGVV